LDIAKGETVGLVGESGSGKSVTALSIMQLIPRPPGKIVSGQILFREEDLLKKSEEEMRQIRGEEISMIFQDPMTSLNPVLTIQDQIAETIKLHQRVKESEVTDRVVEILEMVGIPDAPARLKNYPHQFSGGMRQRVMIAIGLSCHPELLIADEPTTSLDVTVQAQILELMKELKNKTGMSILLITHDLGVIAEMSDRVAVMYAGRIMEYSDVTSIFEGPQSPYTQALLESIPRLDISRNRLIVIPGMIPNLVDPPKGCRFHPRCKYAQDVCRKQEPKFREIKPRHFAACLLLED
jgi:oligopeptide/dipeptide ABC transporter ATP-binding protein